MKIEMKLVQLHTNLFLSSTNLLDKLDIKRAGLKLVYDSDEKELIVYFNAEMAIIPMSNVASMTPVNCVPYGMEEKPKEVKALGGNIHAHNSKAQVSSPTDHVFAEGPGKTGKSK